jgi:hypothetical protein
MNKIELCKKLKEASDILDKVEHALPYDYEQHDDNQAFLASIRQRIYAIRCQLGGVRESIKDERNWTSDGHN